MKKKQTKYFCVVLSVLLLATGCFSEKAHPVETASTMSPRENELNLYIGEISEEISPFFYLTLGDARLLSLLYSKVLQKDSNGKLSEDAGSISVIRDGKKDSRTVYEITLNEKIRDAEGNQLTADDLVFNYYLRCQTGYRGFDQVNQVDIVGLEEYQYGAEGNSLQKIKKNIEKIISHPDKSWKKKIQKEIIQPALIQEYAWTESVYLNRAYGQFTKKYPEVPMLFARFYALDTTYSGKGKTKEQVIKDIAAQYGTDYRKLSQVTGDDYSTAVRCAALQSLYPERETGLGSIKGIRKIDEHRIEIETTGYDKRDKERLGDIYLLPRNLYDDSKKEGGLPAGSGAFAQAKKEKEGWLLTANQYYWRGVPQIAAVQIMKGSNTSLECIEKIKDGRLDMACVWEKLESEKKQIKEKLEEKESSWQVAAARGILFSTERVNATTIPENMSPDHDILQQMEKLEMN